MKILQINSVCGIGSTGRITTDIDKLLKKQGHESYIAYGRNSSQEYDNSIRIGTNLDNYKHVISTRLFDKHGFSSINATKKFIKIIEDLDPEIIHLHNIHGYYINIELLFNYLKRSDKCTIWTLHDCWPFTGHCTYFDYVQCDRWKSGCYDCPQKKDYPSSLFFDSSRSNYQKKKEIFAGVRNLNIITPSNWLARLVKESFLNEYNVQVINNGIDLDVFKPTTSNFRKKYDLNDKFIILGVASPWSKRKGFDYLVELSKRMSQDEKIVMVGLTESQIKHLPKNIVGINRTNNVKELADIYSAADVFVNPTLEDNFPTTNLEALACGTPVISFNTGGSVESVIDGETGFIIEQGNLDGLINKLREIKKAGKAAYSYSCRETANRWYNKDLKYQEYVELYKSGLSLMN